MRRTARMRIDLRLVFFKALKYVSESRKEIFLAAVIFFFSFLIGFIFYPHFRFFDSFLREILDKTENLRGAELIVFIFSNNLQSAFFGLFFGILLGIFPIFNSVLNGGLLGYVFAKVQESAGAREFWRILPHGIFELPAVLISLGLGIKLGMCFFSSNIIKELKKKLSKSIITFIFVVVPLLVIAAIIEGMLITLMN